MSEQKRDREIDGFEKHWQWQQGALFLKEENSSKEWKKSLAQFFYDQGSADANPKAREGVGDGVIKALEASKARLELTEKTNCHACKARSGFEHGPTLAMIDSALAAARSAQPEADLALKQIFAITANFEYRHNRGERTHPVQDLVAINDIAGTYLSKASEAKSGEG